MEYNMEVINKAAIQLGEMIKDNIMRQQEAGQGGITIAGIETHLREVLRQMGLQALGYFLSAMQTTPAKEMACGCGGCRYS